MYATYSSRCSICGSIMSDTKCVGCGRPAEGNGVEASDFAALVEQRTDVMMFGTPREKEEFLDSEREERFRELHPKYAQ